MRCGGHDGRACPFPLVAFILFFACATAVAITLAWEETLDLADVAGDLRRSGARAEAVLPVDFLDPQVAEDGGGTRMRPPAT